MAEIRTRMQEIMTTKVGIFREGEKLKEAVEELEDLYKKSFNVAVKNQPGANPELVYAYRTQKMLRVALGMALGASLRTESRGAHFRVDYPVRNDAEWCKRTLSTWKNESDTLPTITYQDSTSPRWNFLRAGVVTVLRTTLTTPKHLFVRNKSTKSVPNWNPKAQTASLSRMH